MKLDETTSASRLWVLLALFILAVAGVLWGIGNGVDQLATKKPGLYEISVNPDDDVPYFRNGFTHYQYLDGESSKIKLLFNGVTSVYGQALKRSYQLLDETTEYPGYVNLATINHHLGETLTVSPELFDILQDLWDKTGEQKSINMFAGAVMGEWNAVLALSDMSEYDLNVNSDWRNRITSLAEKTADLSQFSVVLDPEHLTVCVQVAPAYLEYLASMECDYPIISAGRLKDAYRLQLISSVLETDRYSNGFLMTDSGLVQVLSGFTGFSDGAGDISLQTGCTVETGTDYAEGGAMHTAGMRHQLGTDRYHPVFRLADGSMPQLFDSCTVTGDIVEACYTALNVFQCTTWEQIEDYVTSAPGTISVVRRMP